MYNYYVNYTPFFYTTTTAYNMDNFEKEEQKFKKGNVESTVTTYFDEDGTVVGTIASSVWIVNNKEQELKELQAKLEEAIEKEDYTLAAEIKKQKDLLSK